MNRAMIILAAAVILSMVGGCTAWPQHATVNWTADGPAVDVPATPEVVGPGGERSVTERIAIDATDPVKVTKFVGKLQTVIVVTQGATITPLGFTQPITAAGALSTGSITIQPAGTRVTLYNPGANTITISDTGTLKLSGNCALSTDDTLGLLSDGTNWLSLGCVAN